jgi:hypothetical protein
MLVQRRGSQNAFAADRGASPLLFGRFLMSLGAFISLEDISEALPPYREEVVSVEMDAPLKQAYSDECGVERLASLSRSAVPVG